MKDATLTSQGGVLTVTLARPAKRNAITPAMWAIVREGLEQLADDDEARVLVLRAAGDWFSAGVDVSGGMNPGGPSAHSAPVTGRHRRQGLRTLHDLFDLAETVEKPVVAAIQGHCLGGALEFALSCDFRLASDAATFGLPEINLGVIPGSGGVSRLTRLVGPGWAKWLVMTDQRVTAEQALAMGLVQSVHPATEFDAAVDALASRLCALPVEALGLAKLSIDLSAGMDRSGARDIERLVNSTLIGSAENQRRLAERFGPRPN